MIIYFELVNFIFFFNYYSRHGREYGLLIAGSREL
jgi:hypothetical protein